MGALLTANRNEPLRLGGCHIRTPGSERSGRAAPASYQSSMRRKEIECVVGSATSPSAICSRVSQRASSSSSSSKRIVCARRVGREAQHQRGGERPGLRGVVVDAIHRNARLFPYLAHDCILQAFARLDEACDRGVAARRAMHPDGPAARARHPSRARSPPDRCAETVARRRRRHCMPSHVRPVSAS